MKQVRCLLAVNDLGKSVAFYRDTLGFKVDLDSAAWALLSRAALKLMLGHCPDARPASSLGDHAWFAYVDVAEIEELYHEYKNNGVMIFQDIADKPWGMREFGIATPDGHHLVFGQALS